MLLPSLLLSLTACGEATTPPAEAVWYPNVQRMVNKQCADCHHVGGQGPFPLETYETASGTAQAMLTAMESGSMPPWHADPDCRHFEGERILSAEDLDLFRRWVDEGTPQGDTSLAEPYTPPADLTFEATWSAEVPGYVPSDATLDDWRCFMFPEIVFDKETWLIGTDVVPATSSVHHVLVYALGPESVEAALAADAAEEGEGYTCYGGPLPMGEGGGGGTGAGLGAALSSTGGFPNQIAAWVPGSEPRLLSDGTAIQVAPGSVIVMQVHYNFQSSSPEPDRSTLKLLRTDAAPTRLRKTTALLYRDLDIPKDDPDVQFTTTTPYYGDAPLELVSFTGHMHQLGANIGAQAWSPGGEETCLVDIPDWDFHWQQRYSLAIDDAVIIQSGSKLDLNCGYDNSQENQPIVSGEQQVSQDVTWGESSTDEMCLLYVERLEDYTPLAPADALACDGVEGCMSACNGSETECLLACDAMDTDCLICALGSVSTCALTCAASLAQDQECVQGCLMGAVMFEGDVNECLKQECGEVHAEFTGCLDERFQRGDCVEELSGCGVTVGG
jgi:hypothetical protein